MIDEKRHRRGVYIAPDPAYGREMPQSLTHQLAQTGHVHAYGYRTASGAAGFGMDPETLQLCDVVCRAAWMYDAQRGVLRLGEEYGNRASAVAANSESGRVAIYEPDAILLRENEELARFRREMRIYEVKSRHGRAVEKPVTPSLAELGIGSTSLRLLDFLVGHASYLIVWAFSEFGGYFRSIDGSRNARESLLQKFASLGLPTFEVKAIDELPVW